MPETVTPKRKIEKAEVFWKNKEKVADAFEAGEDVVAVAIAAVNGTDENES